MSGKFQMKITPTAIPDVLVIEPKVFSDDRGFFFESFNQKAFNQATGLNLNFVQDNHSRSAKGVLRGLHYQIQQPKANWCGRCAGQCLMWRWISARIHPRLENGLGSS